LSLDPKPLGELSEAEFGHISAMLTLNSDAKAFTPEALHELFFTHFAGIEEIGYMAWETISHIARSEGVLMMSWLRSPPHLRRIILHLEDDTFVAVYEDGYMQLITDMDDLTST